MAFARSERVGQEGRQTRRISRGADLDPEGSQASEELVFGCCALSEKARLSDAEGIGDLLQGLQRRKDMPVFVTREPGLGDTAQSLQVCLTEPGSVPRLDETRRE